MRKNIIALMLVLPILFVLVVYNAVNAASLDVEISANGIEIMERYPGKTVSIDLADYDESYEITPNVKPANASNRGFEYRYERISGAVSEEEVASGGVVEVVNDEGGTGRIRAHAAGTVRVVAVSKDGGYEDSLTVIVASSKPYAFDFTLFDLKDTHRTNLLSQEGASEHAELAAGQYGYSVQLKPNTYISPQFSVTEGFLQQNAAKGTIVLPFSGKTAFDVSIPDGAFGALSRHIELDVAGSAAEGDFSVNGETGDVSIGYAKESQSAEFFVEASAKPTVTCSESNVDVQVEPVSGVARGWRVSASLPEVAAGAEFVFTVTVNGVSKEVSVSAKDFDFSIRTDMPTFDAEKGTNLLMGSPMSFYAVPDSVATGITFEWSVYNVDDAGKLNLETSEDGTVCTLTYEVTENRDRDGFILIAEAMRDGEPIYNVDAHEISINVINNVVEVQSMNTQLGLAKSLAIAGKKYVNGAKVENVYPVGVTAYGTTGAIADGIDDLDFELSSPAAEIVKNDDGTYRIEDGCIFLTVKGKGDVTLTASWKGNEDWCTSEEEYIQNSVTFTVDGDAVEVATSNELLRETEAGNPVVLGADIMLGTDDFGNPLDVEVRRGMLKQMHSTYNTQYYEAMGQSGDAYVNYVLEFKNDLYGNGHSVCGEYFSNAQGGSGEPLLFKGPLALVKLGTMASVAAQDNIVFLCRTDGVTIYNAELLGCSDDSLKNPDTGLNDLTRLTYTGTVLEINADVNVLNCRIRNGRNVIRAYGGNRDGQSYFVTALSEYHPTAQDRIVVRVEGCILQNSREFLIKAGTNKALQASSRLTREPEFKDKNGNSYAVQTNDYLADDYFYQTYVLTDLTIADCVLEKSGLFSVGVETNFAGEALCEGGRYEDHPIIGKWVGVGGTSYATYLRLEGNVRMYDWKDLKNVNSDTLIQSEMGQELPMKFDIGAMINFMAENHPDRFGTIIENAADGSKYAHGGIAFYGGGKNYSQISLAGLGSSGRAEGLAEFKINISELEDDGDLGGIGQMLPLAAGTQDFRFYMYDTASPNNRAWQQNASYQVTPVPFA